MLRLRLHLLIDLALGVALILVATLADVPDGQAWPLYLIGIIAFVLFPTTKVHAIGTAPPLNQEIRT